MIRVKIPDDLAIAIVMILSNAAYDLCLPLYQVAAIEDFVGVLKERLGWDEEEPPRRVVRSGRC